ncbi:conserved hypothetical protein [Bradyrhizobium sp. ORS 375]|uniref:hypothetical protein n=1 Tax=Bradyrhizobium sp. (strain ORS 375) TaxID=566679 RepID=UPI0002405F3A|nr:hypothetical protein [Bradyrhizobium sp. ORS 375]CCD96226.1 conserved hypothetical protein [Bradyrhizobium sp. ORS 375]
MQYPAPSPAEIEAAARVLFEEARFYRWFPITTDSYEIFAESDRIGVAELRGIAERMLMAAAHAKVGTRLR